MSDDVRNAAGMNAEALIDPQAAYDAAIAEGATEDDAKCEFNMARARKRRAEAKKFAGHPGEEAGEHDDGKKEQNDNSLKPHPFQVHEGGKREKRGKFTFIPLDQIHVTESEWRIKHVLPETGVAVIAGVTGAYKTFVALDMALSIANGRPWGGKKTTPGACFYICAEGQGSFNNRIIAWKTNNDCHPRAPFFTLKTVINLGSAEGDAAELIASIEDCGMAPAVIVVDTLAKSLGGADENNAGMVAFVSNAEKIAQHFGALVIAVAHVGKADEERLRGHSSLEAGVDTVILCKKLQSCKALIKFFKQKDGDDQLRFEANLRVAVVGLDKDGEDKTSLYVSSISEVEEQEVISITDKMVTAMKANPQGTQTQWAEAAGCSIGAANKALGKLEKQGLVEKIARKYRLVTAPPGSVQ